MPARVEIVQWVGSVILQAQSRLMMGVHTDAQKVDMVIPQEALQKKMPALLGAQVVDTVKLLGSLTYMMPATYVHWEDTV